MRGRPRNNPDEMLDALRTLAERKRRAPTADEVRRESGFSLSTYHSHFGGFSAALRMICVEPRRPGHYARSTR